MSASVHAGIHPPGAYTPPRADTPPGADTSPEQTPLPGADPLGADTSPAQCMLGDTGNKWAVRILLECILVGSDNLFKIILVCIFDTYSFQVQSGFVKVVDLLFEPLSVVMSLVLIWQYVGVATMGAVGVILLYVPAILFFLPGNMQVFR